MAWGARRLRSRRSGSVTGELFIVRKGEDGWLPNLVAGVSVWRLAPDLNVDELFGGCLIEPDVDGPDSLPLEVEWDLTGLVPLAEALERHPREVRLATADFLAKVERAGELFGTPSYERFADAFTLPGLDQVQHWFYDPVGDRLRVMRWGARARGLAARESKVYGPAALIAQERARAASISEPDERRGSGRWLVIGGLTAILVVAAILALWMDHRAESPRPDVRAAPPSDVHEEPPVREDPPPVREEPPPASRQEAIPEVHRRVYFSVGVHEIGEDQRESLEAIGAHLASHPRLRVLLVEGHADVRGEETDNMTLSQRRALSVLRWLEAHGVAHERLRGSGCSERYRAGDVSDEELRRDRRVEVYILDPESPAGVRRHEGCRPVAF